MTTAILAKFVGTIWWYLILGILVIILIVFYVKYRRQA